MLPPSRRTPSGDANPWRGGGIRYPEGLIRQIPNLLTMARLLLAPVVLREIWMREFGWALLLCAIAGSTDAMDGYLARQLHARSRFGEYLDPIADKFLLSGSYLVLGLRGLIPLWITVLVFGRDLLILMFVGLAFALTPARNFSPTIWGKLSTIVQVATVLAVLLSGLLGWGRGFVNFALACVVASTCWSAIHYLFIGVRVVRNTRVRAAH
jgi:cardiolipin synthase